ncbi:zymogen granule membrane protein 16 [Ahaetulla prasina]|uniref:zymogen granule membrane protein 16 n=1 Tax=Ahaetulla prasina TaxID=499056 RepID=UPI002647242B|nr:zymogen granule membrane protein 16 [Ahaetulla prasina]
MEGKRSNPQPKKGPSHERGGRRANPGEQELKEEQQRRQWRQQQQRRKLGAWRGLLKPCFIIIFLLSCSITLHAEYPRTSSFSGEYGGKGGSRFSHSGNQLEGAMTALRIRVSRNYIVGLQVRYGKEWSNYVGGTSGDLEEIFLYPRESIIQVSGKYNRYLNKVVFVTDEGRYFSFGRDDGISFSGAPLFPNTVLRYISGRSSSVINAIGFHWDKYSGGCSLCKEEVQEQEDKERVE